MRNLNYFKLIIKKLKNWELKKKNYFLILLLSADLIFMVLHIITIINYKRMDSSYIDLYNLSSDMSYAEIYQYIKEYWIVLLLLFIAVKKRKAIYFAWSSLFVYFLLDDSLQIHEKVGHKLINYFGFQPLFGLRAQDFGELTVTIFIGVIIFSFIGVFYCRSDEKTKTVSKLLFFLVLFLTIFGVVIDMIAIMIPISFWKAIFGFIEDGGEMIVMSVILGYVYNVFEN